MSAPAKSFANDQPLSRRSPNKELIATLERIVKAFPPISVPPGGGFYYGRWSIGLLFFALEKHYPGLKVDGTSLREWLDAYSDLTPETMDQFRNPVPGRCGVGNDMMAWLALNAASKSDKLAARRLCKCLPIATQSNASNEWLYGRAGYLYLIRLAKTGFTKNQEILNLLDATADEIIQAILRSPRPWSWHGKVYVGAVHGIAGILTQIVLTDLDYAPRLEHQLDSLLQNQYDSGNWPSSLPDGSDRLCQFCHGAPGVITSLLSIREHFPNLWDRIDEAVAAGRAFTKEQGLLTKEPCLCHGTSGNALALEGEVFDHFLSYTTHSEIQTLVEEGAMEASDRPEGLYTGEAGRAWAWAVADRGLEGRFVGYNDL
jgi:lantibiotic modifying enzyme